MIMLDLEPRHDHAEPGSRVMFMLNLGAAS